MRPNAPYILFTCLTSHNFTRTWFGEEIYLDKGLYTNQQKFYCSLESKIAKFRSTTVNAGTAHQFTIAHKFHISK